MKDLVDIRKEIDAIDKEIVNLYEKRLALADDVAIYKIHHKKKIFDQSREEEKLNALASMVEDDFSKQGIVELFEQIMSTSRKKQYRFMAQEGFVEKMDFESVDVFDFSGKTIVYQGVEGAYSQMALKAFFGEEHQQYHVATWRDAMEEITQKRADYAVLPIENSSAGAVTENYDLLMEYDVSIIGEQIIKIDHALLGVKGANIEDINSVYSHPQAFMQCSDYLEKSHPEFEKITMKNTAVSAKKVQLDGKKNQAAIAGKVNAQLYNLEVLEEAIQNNKENETRFIVVAPKKQFLSSANQISISFELPNETGSLYHILSHFIFNGLNMSRIESRPLNSSGKNWEYRFFIDFAGNLKEDAVQNALQGLKAETEHLRILGNY